MFANLESFSIFFFVSLAFIILAIAFEDKLVALEKKQMRKKALKRNSARMAKNAGNNVRGLQKPPVRNSRPDRSFAA